MLGCFGVCMVEALCMSIVVGFVCVIVSFGYEDVLRFQT